VSMKLIAPNLETILLLLVSGGLFVISPPGLQLKLLNFAYHAQAWEKHVNGVSQVLVFYGIVLLTLAIMSYLYSLRGVTLLSQILRRSRDGISTLQKEIIPSIQQTLAAENGTVWLLLVLMIGVTVRAYFLSQPMRYDESYTFLFFVNRGFLSLFNYQLPNNHVLFTLLARVSTLVWGNSPAAIRFPAFLAGIGCIPLTFLLCRALHKSGLFASIAVAVFPYLILYSTNARGYALVVFLTLALAVVGLQIVKRKPSIAGALPVSAIAALGMLTMPSMLFAIAGVYCWLFCLLLIQGQTLRIILSKFVVPVGLITIIFTMILYTPVIIVSNGVESIVANDYVQSQPWPEFKRQVLPHFQATLGEFFRNVPAVVVILCLILVAAGIYASVRKHDWPALLILPVIFLGSVIIFFIQHAIPYPRTWIYFIPLMLLYVDYGFTFINENISYKIRLLVTALIFSVGAFAALTLISTDAITKYPDTGTFPEARMVVNFLEPIMKSNDLVIGKTPADFPTFFYLWAYDGNDHNGEINIEPRKTFYVVKKSLYSVQDLTDRPVIKLLDFGDMALYQADDIEGK